MLQEISQRHQIFAHRGANKEAVEQGLCIAENSRAAFTRALLAPIEGIETDVQLSSDNVPLLWHDWYLDKLGHPGKRVDDFTFKQLSHLDFANASCQGALPEKVLSLQEFIKTYGNRCQLNIEIKSFDSESAQRRQTKIRQTMAILNAPSLHDVFISSFSLSCLEFAHQEVNNFPLFYLMSDHYKHSDLSQLMRSHAFLKGFCLPITSLDQTTIDLLRNSGKVIATYTCNSNEELDKAFALGVDILISDYPQLALSMRSKL